MSSVGHQVQVGNVCTGCGFRSHMSDAEAWHQVEELDSGFPGANAAPALSGTRRVDAHASRTARWLCCGPAARSSAIVQNSPLPSLKSAILSWSAQLFMNEAALRQVVAVPTRELLPSDQSASQPAPSQHNVRQRH